MHFLAMAEGITEWITALDHRLVLTLKIDGINSAKEKSKIIFLLLRLIAIRSHL